MSQQHLSAESIFSAHDLEVEEVSIPEWPMNGAPGIIFMHQLCAEEVMLLTDEMSSDERSKDGMYIATVRCARRADGLPLFTDDDIPKLKRKSLKVLNRLQRIALRMNTLDGKSEVTLKKD